MDLKEITPKIGLGEMHFGLSQEDVKAMLGEPNEIDEADTDLDDGLEFWHYDERELSVAFDEMHDNQMISMAVSSNNYTLKNQSFIGKSADEIIEFLEKENMDYNQEESVISVGDINLNFWMDENQCSEVQWSAEVITNME